MKITICGNFGKDNESLVNGQITKTRNVYKILVDRSDLIHKIDTARNKMFTLLKIVFFYLISDVFILIVSRNGFKQLGKILAFLKKIKFTKTIYMCVGTCPLPADYKPQKPLDEKAKQLNKILKSFDLVCAETEALKQELETVFSITNCCLFKNYQLNKEVANINSLHISTKNKEPIKLVYLSRICSEKNVLSIFTSLDAIGQNRDKILIDFYGPVQQDVEDDFFREIKNRGNCFYKGVLQHEQVNSALFNYDYMLFTTLCLEGTPGVVIDAAFAGLPILSQEFWASNELIVESNIGYVNKDIDSLLLKAISTSNDEYLEMVENSLKFAETYDKEAAQRCFNEILLLK